MANGDLLRNLSQGFQSFALNQPLGDIQQRDEIGRLSQSLQESGDINSPEFQQLAALDPSRASKIGQLFGGIDERRQQAIFTDAREVRTRLEGGDVQGATDVINQRLTALQQLQGDPTQTIEIANLVASGNIPEAIDLLKTTERVGIDQGFLKDPEAERRKLEGQRPALSDPQKNLQQINEIRARGRAAKQAGDIDGQKQALQELKEFKQLTGKFGAKAQTKADIAVDKASRIALSKQAATASKEAFDGLKVVRSTILNIGDAIKALDKGAETGPIISKLPSFRQAAVELDNIRGRMGLDVVGATTFGALSESELAFALDVALPDNLEPAALKDWLQRKRVAQTKLAKGLRNAASFLGKPGNTIADFIEKQELSASAGSVTSGLTEAEAEELRQLESEFGGQ